VPKFLRSFLCITLLGLCHPQLPVWALITMAPASSESPAQAENTGREPAVSAEIPGPRHPGKGSTADQSTGDRSTGSGAAGSLPDAPDAIPVAEPVPPVEKSTPVRIEAQQQRKTGSVYTLLGEVTITYRSYTVRADKVSYNQETGDVEAEGNLEVEGGPDDERIQADHGTFNLDLDTGRFYNVLGSVGVRVNASRQKLIYTGINPFMFTGRVVIKSGPQQYKVIDGTMTSCRLPHPDWRLTAGEIRMNNGLATAKNAFFRLAGVPLLYLPYVTHPVNTERQSGLLIPVYSNSSTKGTVVGEQAYLVLNRSMDLTMGTDYYSKRGWAPSGEFRYRGRGEDFGDLRVTALFDRGIILGTGYQNQGGQDVLLNGRRTLTDHTRLVANAEYLSSILYRQAFAETFSQATASQVNSNIFVTHNRDGFSQSLTFNRYINYTSVSPVADIVIAHLPTVEASSVAHRLEATPFVWEVGGSISGLNRHEPFFSTADYVGRVDAHPTISMPLHLAGWDLRPSLGLRDTFYSKSQATSFVVPPDSNSFVPVYRSASANRKDLEAGLDLRPPVLERDFTPAWLARHNRTLRHVIEPEISYRYVGGINNFSSILRFDPVDIAADTSELQYGLTQRLYFKRLHPKPCTNPGVPAPVSGRIYLPLEYRECGGDTSESVSWTIAQKYFFQPGFGGAVFNDRRNVITSTLDFSGISFLAGPRDYSPIVSRLAFHTDHQIDVGWDLDYDPWNGRINRNNVYADVRHNNYFASVSHALLNELNAVFTSDPATQVTNYNQIRLLVGYGYGTKPGFSAGLNTGYDFERNELQYGGVQTTYNWDCCGLTIEYRRLALGQERNENYESFNFTLAGVGTAGNINRSQMIY
jgi:LPS-assembly protein